MNDKKPKPLISILMAAYNSEKTIRYAIESVLAQTCPDWELLIVDDCSADNTLSIAGSYRDPRIRVFRNRANSGVSLTRKMGLDAAEGAWIAVLDSDDIWAPDKLEKQLCFAQSRGADLVFTGSAFITESGSLIVECTHLTDLTLARTVRKIGSHWINYCSRLTEIKYEGSLADWAAVTKGQHWDGHGGVLPGSLEKVICLDG